jgi:transmembrane protein TMEM164
MTPSFGKNYRQWQQPNSRSLRIPLGLKIAYSVFVAVLVPYYWREYSAWNFLYFCDVALLVTLVGLWTESKFLISLEGVAILLPQTLWLVDLSFTMFGGKLLGMTDYMFDRHIPLVTRLLSSFHGWLPVLLVYLLIRLGYDRRAIWWQSIIGVALLLFCFFFAPKPPPPVDRPNAAININYVWGTDDHHPQTKMPPAQWLLVLSSVIVLGMYVPTHLVLRTVMPKTVAR